MQSGELIVTGKDSVRIPLLGRPREVVVCFKHPHDPIPCNPHHHDDLEYEIQHEDEHSKHHHNHEHEHHHEDRKFFLVIKWGVESVREIVWTVMF